MTKATPEQVMQRLLPKRRRGGQGQSAPASPVILSYDRTVGEKELLYIINNETTGKSYLCPADDKIPPICGVWTTIDNSELPINMQEWLTTYEEDIELLQKIEGSDDEAASDSSEPTINPTLPFNNKWDQSYNPPSWESDDPYVNKLTYGEFITGSRKHWKVCGCPATVWGQVFTYWSTLGYYIGCKKITPYSYDYNSLGSPYYVNVNLSPVSNFDFDNLLSQYKKGTTYPQENKDALSTLLQYTATSAKSVPSYTVDKNSDGTIIKVPKGTTGANPYNTLQGIRKNFLIDVVGYSMDDCYGFTTTTQSNMENLIKTEIMAGRPVVVRGERNLSNSKAGHTFLCHGYTEKDGYKWLYINWGDGGVNSGWYKFSLLNSKWKVDDPNYGYNKNKRIIINIQPRHSKYNIDHNLLVKVLRNVNKNITTSSNLFKELNFDYDDKITDGDAETLAGFIMNDVDRTDEAKRKTFKLASVVSIRKSCREILNKLNALKNN